jgi:pSer/pThr/pTyr-binding forkhead associated (FHA) protein
MEQARNYVCKECSTAVPSGHKFCGTCGAAVPPEVVELRIKYFGPMQAPGKARLILIRGEGGVDGLSYMLQGTEHLAGREDGQILFPEDTWLSPRHANFVYENGQLVVRDEGSLNGVYVRVRAATPPTLTFGDTFLCGEQLFRVEAAPRDTAGPAPDQTYFYASPRKRITFKVVQVLAGGGAGIAFCATGPSMTVGREECDINFPLDVYMSGTHARLEMTSEGVFSLVDTDSKNGTYVRIKGSQPLHHGDYLFLGRELLRVEMTA